MSKAERASQKLGLSFPSPVFQSLPHLSNYAKERILEPRELLSLFSRASGRADLRNHFASSSLGPTPDWTGGWCRRSRRQRARQNSIHLLVTEFARGAWARLIHEPIPLLTPKSAASACRQRGVFEITAGRTRCCFVFPDWARPPRAHRERRCCLGRLLPSASGARSLPGWEK